MKIYLAADHAGFELKERIKEHLGSNSNFEVQDCGAHEFDKNDDYPDLISKAADNLSRDPKSKGIVLGGSGQGEAMIANKFPNVRCALFYGPVVPAKATDANGSTSDDAFEMLKLTREHNNSNCLSLGSRFLSDEDALKAVDIFLNSNYSGEERHQRRIDKIKAFEK